MSDPAKMTKEQRARAYWQENQRLITILLVIWFVVSYVPVFFINQLNGIVIAGFPFGYYMGSQGSLIVFVIEIFYYAYAMKKMDQRYHVSDKTTTVTKK